MQEREVVIPGRYIKKKRDRSGFQGEVNNDRCRKQKRDRGVDIRKIKYLGQIYKKKSRR